MPECTIELKVNEKEVVAYLENFIRHPEQIQSEDHLREILATAEAMVKFECANVRAS